MHCKHPFPDWIGRISMDQKALVLYFHSLDRAIFLDGECKALAGVDSPLPIGHGQTISQPSLVLEMTRLLSPEPDSSVLEIGTGSGYQTALLARFSGKVCTVERIPDLSRRAKMHLDSLGFDNIHYKIGDGSFGCPEKAPFDRIIVTAAAGHVPLELISQLRPSGRMVIPVGPPAWQELMVIKKNPDGTVTQTSSGTVRFVELVGPYGWG
jgi:protein-L-isoaspartate(D-aspartate) O-methyltransferase